MTNLVTDFDRKALAAFTREWRGLPACFTPNDYCRGAVERGLIEFEGPPGAMRGRLTERGAAMLESAGQA
jgi:hypothetical protein